MKIPRGVLFPLLGVLLVLFAGTRHGRLVEMRQRFQLQAVPPEDTTPLVALTTVAFGGFRGLVADVLWVRAASLQEEGQYFELVQLAKWISQLEPRVPEVWSFQSWNLAYNISVLFPDYEDRWRWVQHGIDLLRRQGLAHNPAAPSLYWDIGWMYQHKIGMRFDEAHPVFRRELALDVDEILPGGRLPPSPAPGTRKALRDAFVMDLDIIRRLDERYGPIDWRVPEAHSLYWAAEGEPLADTRFMRGSLRRMRFTSLRMLMWKGRLAGSPADDASILLPRPELVPVLQAEFQREQTKTSDPVFARSHQAFLADALLLYTELGRHEDALPLYQALADMDPELSPDETGFRQWTADVLRRDPQSLRPDHALLRVVTGLIQAREHRAEQPALASRHIDRARQTHRRYQASLESPDLRARVGLPDFQRLLDTIVTNSGNF